MSADHQTVFWTSASDERLHSVPAKLLIDPTVTEAELRQAVQAYPPRGFASDGLEMDAQNRLYLSDLTHNAIERRTPAGAYEVLVREARLLWPDCLRLAHNGYLYFTVNQNNRNPLYHEGVDLRQPPYALLRMKVSGTPVVP